VTASVPHRFDFREIREHIWHGLKQLIRLFIPLIDPEPETGGPPQIWLEYYDYRQWAECLATGSIPLECWCWRYWFSGWYALRDWVEEIGDHAIDKISDVVSDVVGTIKSNYATVAAWIDNLDNLLGYILPDWCVDVFDGLWRLYLKFPYHIRHGLKTWEEIFDKLADGIQDWVEDTYDDLVAMGQSAYGWVLDSGKTIAAWYDEMAGWLVDFRTHRREWVQGWLGAPWNKLERFVETALDFYNLMWYRHADTIGEFFADPLGWLYDRVEDELVRRW
jgi:hypothetical protein